MPVGISFEIYIRAEFCRAFFVDGYVVVYMTNTIQGSYFARSDILKYLPSCHISIPLSLAGDSSSVNGNLCPAVTLRA